MRTKSKRFGSGSRALMTKTTNYLSLGLYKERPSYRRRLQLSKKDIQHFKTWIFKQIFYFCGSFLPSWIHWPDWIWIQSLSTASCLDVHGVSLSITSSMAVQGVSISTASSLDVQGVFLSITSSMDVQGVFWEQIKLFCFLSDNERTISKRFAFVPIISGPNQNVLLWFVSLWIK